MGISRGVEERLRGELARRKGAKLVKDSRVMALEDAGATMLTIEASAMGKEALETYRDQVARHAAGILIVGAESESWDEAILPPSAIVTMVDADCSDHAFHLAVEGIFDRIRLTQTGEHAVRDLRRSRYELQELVEIGTALSQERDVDKLLSLILEKSRMITRADAGSIYVIERGPEQAPQLRFKLSQNESCSFESSEFSVPISTESIVGAAVVTKAQISIDDVYAIEADAPYHFDGSFDEKVGYRTASMITVPMISAEDEVIGVIQLINKKRDPKSRLYSADDVRQQVIPFTDEDSRMLETLSSQAGVALENALLYDEIKTIFEGFVRASVQAIEQRDPTTSGHSLRVSVLSCELAQTVDALGEGKFASARFSKRQIKELEYAALLHDFGKIGVREQVLVKAKKLYPWVLDNVRARFHYALLTAEADYLRKRVELLEQGASAGDVRVLEAAWHTKQASLREGLAVVEGANEPSVLSQGDFSRIAEIGSIPFLGPDGVTRALLDQEEIKSLQVMKGSLNTEEVRQIQSHVVHTYNFLARIPWGKTYAAIPKIAGAHHEKIDGSGYPKGLKGDAIPLPSKIMTVADIYDALTARDRPYKRAVPFEKALDILGYEVKDGHLDADLVKIFIDAKVFHAVDKKLEY